MAKSFMEFCSDSRLPPKMNELRRAEGGAWGRPGRRGEGLSVFVFECRRRRRPPIADPPPLAVS